MSSVWQWVFGAVVAVVQSLQEKHTLLHKCRSDDYSGELLWPIHVLIAEKMLMTVIPLLECVVRTVDTRFSTKVVV